MDVDSSFPLKFCQMVLFFDYDIATIEVFTYLSQLISNPKRVEESNATLLFSFFPLAWHYLGPNNLIFN